MHLISSTPDLVMGGRPYPGFPILLWDSMDSCIPVNRFLRHYLLRGAIGSRKSWANTGRALYDYFGFLQAHVGIGGSGFGLGAAGCNASGSP
jgi:integrase/recombinase XerD